MSVKTFTFVLAAALVATGCAASRGASRADQPREGAPRPFTLPAPARYSMPNGLKVTSVERSHLPMVTVQLYVRAGAALDPAATPGLADVTSQLLRRGAGNRTAPQLAEAIDATGGDLSVAADRDGVTLTLSVLKRDLATGLGLLADVVRRPKLDATELARLIEEQRAGLEAELDDGDAIADRALRRAVLGAHPAGRLTTRASLKRLNRAQVQAFYRSWYRPARTDAIVVGDVTADEAREAISQALGGWKATGVTKADPVAVAPPAPQAKTRVWLVDMDVTQGFVRIGAPAPAYADADRLPLRVGNYVLGGDFTSRLNQDIRDKEGLSYGAYSRFSQDRDVGIFSAKCNTKTETSRRAADRLLALIGAMRTTPVTTPELSAAQAFLAGAFPMRFEKNVDVAGELATLVAFGLPDAEITTYRDRVRALRPETILDAYRRQMPSGGFDVVIVGKTSVIEPQVRGLGEIRRIERRSLVE